MLQLTTAPASPAVRAVPGARAAHTLRVLCSRIRRGPLGRPGALFAIFLLITFANFAAWSLATPLFASPDEPTQVLSAAAAVRGELVGFTIDGAGNAFTAVHVPEVFASGPTYPVCFKYHPAVPASCASSLSTSTKTVHIGTYVGRYPPLYYLIVGLPSLAFVSKTGIYLMRLMSALLNAVLVSLALFAVVTWSRRKLLLVGVMAAATPMAWFLGGMVNPSGFEICAAICLWTAGLVLVLDHPDRPPPGLLAIVAVSAGLLALARPLSPVWVAIAFVVLALLGGRRALLGLLRSRAARWWVVPLAACAGFSLWWIATQHALDLVPGYPVTSDGLSLSLIGNVLAHDGVRFQQLIGVFGWNDTTSPVLTYVIWLGIVAMFFVLALRRAIARRAGTLLLLFVAVVVVPFVLAYVEAVRAGFVDGQGRYWLPLAVGVPLVSAALVGRSSMPARFSARVVPIVAVGLAVASITAYLGTLRRYAVGVNGAVDFLDGKWQPPVGLLGAALGGSAAIALLLAVVVVVTRQPSLARFGVPEAESTRSWQDEDERAADLPARATNGNGNGKLPAQRSRSADDGRGFPVQTGPVSGP